MVKIKKKKKKREANIEKISIDTMIPVKAMHQPKKIGEGAGFSVINTHKHGNRVQISKKNLEELGNPTEVQFRYLDKSIIMAPKLSDEDNYFRISNNCIYSKELVLDITEKFSLDFSEVTSISFRKVNFDEIDRIKVAIVSKPNGRKNKEE